MPTQTVQHTWRIRDTVLSLTVSWVAYSEGKLVGQGSPLTVQLVPKGADTEVNVTAQVTLPAVGTYQIDFEYQHLGISYVAQKELLVEQVDRPSLSAFTLTGTLTLDTKFTAGTLQLFDQNNLVQSLTIPNTGLVDLDLSVYQLGQSLDPYICVAQSGSTFETFQVYFVTPQIMTAVQDLRNILDRLNRQLQLNALEFLTGDYLFWLKAGRDKFNSHPVPTAFNLTRCDGPIYHWWILCCQIVALRVRYLEEGLTSFNYGGAASTLDVDVTQYIDTMANTLEAQLSELSSFKRNLANRGLTSGAGQWATPARMGSVGITLGPMTRGRRGLRRW